ncbi:AAA family ATPase [Sphingobium chlorophenolicum]|uniref:Exonuclease n=1 Tax=Sphingobium chlorophenolicum TaxID=46429 RepID=A0A081REU9_SPHCR|nr:SMC family ATPase [Sphingobium chlorophenolicum]KEQ53722.1 Exonuclease [Sphingobium chlorophenolicum]
MRPIKLIMSAFGPYAGMEEIDFRDAVDAGLFGIYGPTGSGKSSIFSAMTFALFGEGAKKEQSIFTMRSQHADPDRLTEVSFLFGLGDRRYFVRRQPDQARPKKRGDGETVDSHAAWLFDASDVPVDDVTTDNCGVVLAEKKVGEVGRQVRELLGYGVEQFRQIVLLPQGRFEKFLLATSDERVAILRELFDVSLYRDITKRMKEGAISAKREFEDGHRLVAQRLTESGFASTDELATGIEAARHRAIESDLTAVGAETISAAADKAHSEAEALEARFSAVENARSSRAALETQRDDVAVAERAVTTAQKALKATDLDARVVEAERSFDDATAAEAEARGNELKAISDHDESELAFVAAEAAATGVDGLIKRSNELERHREALTGAADLKAKFDLASADRKAAQDAFDTADASRVRLETVHNDLSERVAVARSDALKRAQLDAKLGALREEFRAAKAFTQAKQRLDAAIEDLGKVKARRDQTAGLVVQSQEQLALAERAFIGAQAQMLASMHLVNGEPCPVCGSADHPQPAHGEGDPKRLERDFNEARRKHDGIVRDATIAEGAITPAEALVSDRTKLLAEQSAPRADVDIIEREGREVADELSALGEPVDLGLMESDLVEAKREAEEAIVASNAARSHWQDKTTAQAVAARSYQDAISGVPELLRDASVLDAEVSSVDQKIKSLREAVAAADKQRQSTAVAKATAAEQLTAAARAVGSARSAVTSARGALAKRLEEVGLSLDTYREGVKLIPEIGVLIGKVQKFRDDVNVADARVDEAQKAVENVSRPDLTATAQQAEMARGDALAARRTAAEMDAALKLLVDLRTSLLEQLDNLERLERETGPLRSLADAFAGDNALKTPLETFAIGTMFDHVLNAANLRLGPMTAGRYRFERDVESVGGRSKRGLDVRVHDIETGRAREISTLSGGETFIAALSLALGLADIVEMSHGQIRLDTIFIDEGFGSLDTDNDGGTLDLVLNVLQAIVGNSRAVGLISHVPMVQQAVPNGFSIVKSAGGNRIERRVA